MTGGTSVGDVDSSDIFAWNSTGEFGDVITDFQTVDENDDDVFKFDVGTTGSQIRIGDNDSSVENYREGSFSQTNVAGTEIVVRTNQSFTSDSVQATIDSYNNINTGTLFGFFDSTKGHAVLYYDLNLSLAGGAVLVADITNITSLTSTSLNSLSNLDEGYFEFV